jgi:hypothetical protein
LWGTELIRAVRKAAEAEVRPVFLTIQTKASLLVGDIEVKFALGGLNLGDIDMEVADRIGLERLLGRLIAFDLCQAADAMSLKAAVKRLINSDAEWWAGGPTDTRRVVAAYDGGRRRQPLPLQPSVLSISTLSGRSATKLRFLHFAAVFGLMP